MLLVLQAYANVEIYKIDQLFLPYNPDFQNALLKIKMLQKLSLIINSTKKIQM